VGVGRKETETEGKGIPSPQSGGEYRINSESCVRRTHVSVRVSLVEDGRRRRAGTVRRLLSDGPAGGQDGRLRQRLGGRREDTGVVRRVERRRTRRLATVVAQRRLRLRTPAQLMSVHDRTQVVVRTHDPATAA